MLLGADLTVFTDHKNLTYENFNTRRVMQWRCYVEELSPKIKYLEEKLNVLADAFSCMPRTDSSLVTIPNVSLEEKPAVLAYFMAHLPRDNSEDAPKGKHPADQIQSFAFSMDPLISSYLMNLPDDEVEPHIENYLNLLPNSLVIRQSAPCAMSGFDKPKMRIHNCSTLQIQIQRTAVVTLGTSNSSSSICQIQIHHGKSASL